MDAAQYARNASQPSLLNSVRPPAPVHPVAQEQQRLRKAARDLLAFFQAHEGQWFTNGVLMNIAGLRYGGRIFELRQHGWLIEDERPKRGGTWRYKFLGRKSQ